MLKEHYNRIKETTNVLSSIDTEALFDFWTYTVSLDNLDLNDISALSEDNTSIPSTNFNHRKVLSLAHHEYTHFIDMTSTVWGIKHLLMMKDAYSLKGNIPGEETSFYKAKKFDTHITKIKYPKYYRVIGEVKNPKDWQMMTTMGKLFGVDGRLTDESIIFVRFKTLMNEEIARSPISPVAILEASAMANEILVNVELLKKLSGEAYDIQNGSFSERILKTIYNKELTEYTACVHLVSVSQRCTDVLQAFLLVSLICKTVLNCTDTLFDKILEENRFKDILGVDENHTIYKTVKDGLIYRNMGVLFYLIVYGLPVNSYINLTSANTGISIALNKLGIDINLVKELAKVEFDTTYNEVIKTDIDPLIKLANAAKTNFDLIDIKEVSLPFEELHLPKIILGDFDGDELAERFIYNKEDNIFEDYNIDEATEVLLKGQEWVKRFSESCI